MNSELKQGIKSESEHSATIEKIIADVKAGKVRALKEYFKLIAEDHLKEIPDYYSRLVKMEKLGSRIKAFNKIAKKD